MGTDLHELLRSLRVWDPEVTELPGFDPADLHARSIGALAAALTGRQSDVLDSVEELAGASDAAWDQAQHDPNTPAPTWTLYRLPPDEAEFFQGDARRRHVRLNYRRTE